jgi:hypothetical protein
MRQLGGFFPKPASNWGSLRHRLRVAGQTYVQEARYDRVRKEKCEMLSSCQNSCRACQLAYRLMIANHISKASFSFGTNATQRFSLSPIRVPAFTSLDSSKATRGWPTLDARIGSFTDISVASSRDDSETVMVAGRHGVYEYWEQVQLALTSPPWSRKASIKVAQLQGWTEVARVVAPV